MKLKFKPARPEDTSSIWKILQRAIENRKKEGSNQWQDGYPNPSTVKNDIEQNAGYVLIHDNKVIGYCAIFINDEPEYKNIKGHWLTDEDFVVAHRIAIADDYSGRGLAQKLFNFIEDFAIENGIYSIKADTNFDNQAMLRIFKKLGYHYCGEVYFRGSPRKAFEKVLKLKN